MELKKNPEADLEKNRGLFTLIGLAFSLALMIGALEWKTYTSGPQDLGALEVVEDDEIIPITERQNTPPPPPPPPPQDIIQVVQDNVELEEELEIQSTETTQDEVVEAVEVEVEESDEIISFAVIEKKAIYPGCENEPNEDARFQCMNLSLQKFFSKNVVYPEQAKTLGVQGKVFVSFVIEKDGKVGNVQVARGVDPSLDAAAVAVVKKLPKMTPAQNSGRPARMSYTIPISFKLQ
jgi:protein TonB